MTDDELSGNGMNALSGADMLALLTRIDDMLSKMEGRIMDRLAANSQGATDRWKKHDDELVLNAERVIKRFEKIEVELLEVSRCIHGHLAKEHDEEVALQARIMPVRSFGLWLAQNWRSLLLALLALLGVMGWAGLEAHITTQ